MKIGDKVKSCVGPKEIGTICGIINAEFYYEFIGKYTPGPAIRPSLWNTKFPDWYKNNLYIVKYDHMVRVMNDEEISNFIQRNPGSVSVEELKEYKHNTISCPEGSLILV